MSKSRSNGLAFVNCDVTSESAEAPVPFEEDLFHLVHNRISWQGLSLPCPMVKLGEGSIH